MKKKEDQKKSTVQPKAIDSIPKKVAATRPTAIKAEAVMADPVVKDQQYRVIALCLIVIAGLLSSLGFHSYLASHGQDFYPYNSFLFIKADQYNDYFNIYDLCVNLDPYYTFLPSGCPANYFPFAYIIMHLFNFIERETSLLAFIGTFGIFLAVYVYRNMPFALPAKKILATIVLSFMTYPILFEIDRGNIEAWLMMSLILFVYFYIKGQDLLSILFLSMAISLKLFPAVFVILFITDRKYKLIVYAGICSIALTLLSAAVLKGGIHNSYTGLAYWLDVFNKKNALDNSTFGLRFNMSVFVPLKLLYYDIMITRSVDPALYVAKFIKMYTLFAFAVFGIIGIIMLIYKAEFWRKVTLLILASIVLQQFSGDYKLIHVLIPVILFINSKERSKYDRVFIVLFGLLLIPKDYIYIMDDLSIASIINPLLIFGIMGIILFEMIKKNEKLNLISTIFKTRTAA